MLLFLAAIFPLGFFCFFLIFRQTRLLLISALTFVLTIFIAFFFWHLLPLSLILLSTKGFFVALDILIIIFGALLFLNVLKELGILSQIAHLLLSFTSDFRYQVILLAWFFENFLEGVAGFGTPSTVVAPLLVALGLPPLQAVVISLLGNSTSVVFGAVGTPIRVGLAEISVNLSQVATSSALFNFVGLLVPSFMLWILSSLRPHRRQFFLEALPFALFSGIAFVVPAYFITLFGYEFPSIIGSIVGLLLVLLALKLGFFSHSSPPISSLVAPTVKPRPAVAVIPYLIFIIILIIGKIILSPMSLFIPFINYHLSLFNPGWAFVLAAIVVALAGRLSMASFRQTAISSFLRALEPFLVTAAMSMFVQIMNNTAIDSPAMLSMTQTLSQLFSVNFLPLIAPLIGAFGSFVTGSATVANLMFATTLANSAQVVGFSVVKILALSLVGAAAGNMIAISDVIAAHTVAGVKEDIRQVIKGVLAPCLIYLALVAVIGLVTPLS